MNYLRHDVISLIILYWCSLGGGAQSNRTVRQSSCQGLFQCSSGECVDMLDVCNGKAQCTDKSDETPTACDCGVRNGASGRVNAPGVSNALLGAHPWHVGVYKSRSGNHMTLLCSGALIYSNIVLTSASCVTESSYSLAPSVIHVSAGKLKRDYVVDEPNQQRFSVSNISIRDRYQGDTKGYARNLALLKLSEGIKRTPYVAPICLWLPKTFPAGPTTATITGWGMQASGNYAINMREARANVMDINNCVQKYYDPLYKRFLTNDKFCLTFDQGVGLKDDDTGGPVVIFHEGRYYLLGILSVKIAGIEFGIATKVEKHIEWIKNTSYDLKLDDNCNGRHFKCNSGCIKMELVCDGKRDCTDGTDEQPVHCPSGASNPTSPETGKRCEMPEGKQIPTLLKCGTPGGCKSQYFTPSFSTYNIACPEGYGFANPDTKKVTVVCSDGSWIPPLDDNRCLKLCSKLELKSLELHCSYLGINIPCSNSLRPSTVIQVRCKQKFKKRPLVNYINETVCQSDGLIRHELSDCTPECGMPFNIENAEVQISNGTKLKYAKYPWHIALYWKKILGDGSFDYEYKCGGTLIDTNKVLTAGHCIWEASRNSPVPAQDLALALGKLHSNWWTPDTWELKIGVDKVIPGNHYNGAKTKHAQDIAVLILKKDVDITDYIMPACLDLNDAKGGIPANQYGHVVGWGRLSEDDNKPSELLMEAWMEYLDLDTCRTRFEKLGFSDYLLSDKFCVLYTNGSGTQMGDSGGGLTFTHDNLHYIYGVVSIKKTGQNQFAAFTNILSHKTWLREILNKY